MGYRKDTFAFLHKHQSTAAETRVIPPPTYMARFRNPTPLLRGLLLTFRVFLGLDAVLHHHRWGIKSKVGLVSQQRDLDWRGWGWTIYSITLFSFSSS